MRSADEGSSAPLLEFDNLSVEFRTGGGRRFRAVDTVSFAVNKGETVGLVGESGSGKTTIGMTAVGLAPVSSGRVRFNGQDISKATTSQRRRLSSQLQVIFQDPYSSLNPLRTIGQTLIEPLMVHKSMRGGEATHRVVSMLEKVGMDASAADRYPSNFSGGQRQRIAIARALVASPELVICDEAVSALDLSIQAQVLNLLLELQKDLDVSYLFISHDLAVVRHMCDRIVVLYRGQVMEVGESTTINDRPSHPYTQALLAASPIPDPVRQAKQRERVNLSLSPSRPQAPTGACRFANRCHFATEQCETQTPPLATGPSGALVACHHADQASATFAATAGV